MTIRVKICGITRSADASVAATAGADAVGMIFYPKSPRALTNLEVAAEIANTVGPFVSTVGVFFNADKSEVERVLRRVNLQLLQFHGDETAEYCRSFSRPYLKVLRVAPDANIECFAEQYPDASGLLLDTYVEGLPGGTGKHFEWRRLPILPMPLIVAGGLSPVNVAEAVKATHAYGVDVASGVEASPGIKDPSKIREFIRNAKAEKFSD